jgi:hypothetical protein
MLRQFELSLVVAKMKKPIESSVITAPVTGQAPIITTTANGRMPVVTATVTRPSGKTGTLASPQLIPPDFERMPPELKLLNNWVLWRYLPPKSGSGKPRKVPFQPNGQTASTTDRSTWSGFEECCAAYALGGFAGVGFVFDGAIGDEGLCYCGVDFDSCTKDGNDVHSLARSRIKRLGTYTERSVSGTGFHCIARAKPLDRMVKFDDVEVYTNARYFTFTGKGFGQIKAAPAEIRSLVDELRAKQAAAKQPSSHFGSDRTFNSDLNSPFSDTKPAPAFTTLGTPESLAEGILTTYWYETLSPEKKDEVIDHALGVIANKTRLLELEADGGNNAEYYKLTTSVARSGAANAEDIFVKYATGAKTPDSEEALRQHFSRCRANQPSGNRDITVGTLLHLANVHGADFSKWKQQGSRGAASEVLFVPGNEQACRETLDLAVAADARTFVLAGGGPLVILRVPDKSTLEAGVRWDGDLPGTTMATPADVMERAEKISWMKIGPKEQVYRIRPPRDFISDYIVQMRGRYGARVLQGIARVPRIDDNGEISFISGYDPKAGLYHDKPLNFDVPGSPTRDEARDAMKLLLVPLSKYKFEDQAKGRAQLLGMILTALERPWLPTAPLICVRSSMPATGKGKLVRSIVRLAYDTVPVFATWGANGEEFEKRLASLLLSSAAAICIDNVNGRMIQGDLLESIITEGRADIRPLGVSEIVRVRNRSLITLTGNNPIITGDMARRTLAIDIQPRSADPERDRYDFDPTEVIAKRRIKFLQAAYTIMRAFRQAGMPSHGLPAVGSFSDWSRKVRDPVFWLTGYDLAEAFRQNKVEDPRRQDDAALMRALHDIYGSSPFTSSGVLTVYSKVSADKRASHPVIQKDAALYDALERVLGSKRVDAKLFGHWARRLKKAHIGGFLLETHLDPATNANLITICRR